MNSCPGKPTAFEAVGILFAGLGGKREKSINEKWKMGMSLFDETGFMNSPFAYLEKGYF